MKKIFSLAALTAIVLVSGGCSLTKTAPVDQSAPVDQTVPVDQPAAVDSAPADNSAAASAPVSLPVEVPLAASVDISSFSFSPSLLNIKPGTTVTWTNSDAVPHTVKFADFLSDAMEEGQSFSYTFNDSGIFEYSCSIHSSMTGKIIVQ